MDIQPNSIKSRQNAINAALALMGRNNETAIDAVIEKYFEKQTEPLPTPQTSPIPKDLNNAITEWGEQFEKIKIEERYLRRSGQYQKERRCNNAQRKNKRKKRK